MSRLAVRLAGGLLGALAFAACSPPTPTFAPSPPPAAHPAVAEGMNGVWLPNSRSSGRLPRPMPLNEEAKKAAEHYAATYGPIDPTVDDFSVACLPEAHPYSMGLFAQYPFELLFTPGQLTVFFEIYGGVRRIYLDPARADDDVMPSVLGHSVGHWEGDTLVIETSRIRKEGFGRLSGSPPISAARRTVERLSLGMDEEGRKQLTNEITVYDEPVLTQPVSFTMNYKWSPDIEVGEYLCQQDIWDQNVQGSPSSVPWRH